MCATVERSAPIEPRIHSSTKRTYYKDSQFMSKSTCHASEPTIPNRSNAFEKDCDLHTLRSHTHPEPGPQGSLPPPHQHATFQKRSASHRPPPANHHP
eukprot:4041706-Pyramimonas_sp.AAC.3